MSKIDDLVAELCPDGVEFTVLRDVGTWYGGATPSKAVREYWENGSIPWLSPKDMTSGTIVGTLDQVSQTAVEQSTLRLVPEGSVVFVVRSNVLRRRLPIARVPIAVTLNQDMRAVVPHDGIVAEYLAHACRARADEILATAGRTDGSMAAIRGPALLDFRIPVPPVAVQLEVVAVLSKMESLGVALDAELTCEREARQRQLAHYRDRLLDFSDVEIEWSTLGEVAANLDSQRRPVTKSARVAGDVPYYGASGIVDYVRDYLFDGDYLLVSEDGANLLARSKPIAFSISGKAWVNNHAHVLEFGSYAERRFAEIYLNSIDLSPYVGGGAQPKLNQANLNRIPIPVPDIDGQERVVEILDRFNALVTDLSTALPAELRARRQQYEHYRDRLLTFDQAAA